MSNALFNSVQMRKPMRSTFDLTHDVKFSTKFGVLTPICAFDLLPSDRINLGCDALIKLAPILAPIMHRVDFTQHYFVVPTRIMWENWEKFIVDEKDENGDPYIQPYVTLKQGVTNPAIFKLCDYLGISVPELPTQTAEEKVLAYPFKAFLMIYNEYYRDQNLIDEIEWNLVDGNNTTEFDAIFSDKIFYRAWEHDYFTSCLPFAQKGSAVDLPLGNVILADNLDATNNPFFQKADGGVLQGNVDQQPTPDMEIQLASDPSEPAYLNPAGSLVVGPTTINDLRRAYRLQEWLEKNARGGTRYFESILVHFNLKSPDARMQRPEYITGIKSPVIVSEVLNTTGPTDFSDNETGNVEQTGSPQGPRAGLATGMHQGRVGNYRAQEHSWVIGIFSIMPKTAYQQGINRMFQRESFLDYAWPTFAQLGEQEVYTREIFAYHDDSVELFGYIPRYAEYKFLNSRVAGDFRTTLKYWHCGRIFSDPPRLNQDFIEMRPEDVSRIFAVEDSPTDNVWCHILHKIRGNRPLPFFGTPTI